MPFARFSNPNPPRIIGAYQDEIAASSLQPRPFIFLLRLSTLKLTPMKKFLWLACVPLLCLTGCEYVADSETSVNPTATEATDTADREFEMTYGAKILEVPEGATVKVWMPVAQSSPQQQVELTKKVTPADLQMNQDADYGNQIGYFEIKQPANAAAIDFSLQYDVSRKQAGLDDSQKTLNENESQPFLNANSLVPKTGKPIELLADKSVPKDPQAAGELLYQVVEDHMKYDKSKPGYGNGDSIWACDSQTGNCTDFHSLFISLARSREIPARFQIGFSIPNDKPEGNIGGYHCWAWFHVDGQGWLPVDISEADKHPEMKSFFCGNLTRDRVTFSTGRDIQLVPASQTKSLNYFVYPHVEVDGQKWPKEKIKLDFSYKNSPVEGKE